jgi:phosphoglycerate dehydrogenase-like enzyme
MTDTSGCTLLVVGPDAAIYSAAIRQADLAAHVITAPDAAAALGVAAEADCLAILAPSMTQALVDAMPRLRWIQALTTGTDTIDRLKLPDGIHVTSARGIHGPQMSELAFLFMLSLARDFPRMLHNQQAATWQRWPQPLLMGRTAVLVGVGTISEMLAARCQAFGMRVLGVSSGRSAAPGFDAILPREALAKVAAEADFLIVLAPYSEETHHMVDARVLACMRPTAFLINIARGGVVDEAALIDALRAGRIAGAGLDVFAAEPLPAQSPLWGLPNVVLTPHIGGMSDFYATQAAPVLVENLRHYLEGTPERMRNIVAGHAQ